MNRQIKNTRNSVEAKMNYLRGVDTCTVQQLGYTNSHSWIRKMDQYAFVATLKWLLTLSCTMNNGDTVQSNSCPFQTKCMKLTGHSHLILVMYLFLYCTDQSTSSQKELCVSSDTSMESQLPQDISDTSSVSVWRYPHSVIKPPNGLTL